MGLDEDALLVGFNEAHHAFQLLGVAIVFVLGTLPCEAAVSTPSFFEAILDASQQMTSATDYDRKFLDELKSCWSTFDPE